MPLGNAPHSPRSIEPITVSLCTLVLELTSLFDVTAICKLATHTLSYSCRLPASYTMDRHPWAHGGFLWNPSYTASRSLLHSHALSHPLLTLSLPILTSTQSRAPRQFHCLTFTSLSPLYRSCLIVTSCSVSPVSFLMVPHWAKFLACPRVSQCHIGPSSLLKRDGQSVGSIR